MSPSRVAAQTVPRAGSHLPPLPVRLIGPGRSGSIDRVQRHTRHSLAAAGLALLAALTGGCELPGSAPEPPEADRPPLMPGVDRRASDDEPRRMALIVRVRMYSIEVPVGTASGSEDLCSYLNEEPIAAARSGVLGRNGLRAGLGREGSWADVERILQRMTGRTLRQTKAFTPPHAPVPIALKERVGRQTIFVSRANRTLTGADYPPCDNVLIVLPALDQSNPNIVHTTVRPVLRTVRRKPRFVRGSRGITMASKPEYFDFPSLRMQMPIARGEFLVIGPGPAVQRPTSMGHHLLVTEKDGMLFETVLVLVPESFLSPVEALPRAR